MRAPAKAVRSAGSGIQDHTSQIGRSNILIDAAAVVDEGSMGYRQRAAVLADPVLLLVGLVREMTRSSTV